MGDIPAQRLGESAAIIREDLRIVRSTGDGDVCHSIIDQLFRGKICIDVDQYALGRLPLTGIARDGITMIQMRVALGIDAQISPAIEPYCHSPVLIEVRDCSKLAVCDPQVLIRSSELNSIADREGALLITVDGYPGVPPRVVRALAPIRSQYR